jgi:hypothetical protein
LQQQAEKLMPDYIVNYLSDGKQRYGIIEGADSAIAAAFVARQANKGITVLDVREIEKEEIDEVGE